MMATGNVGTVIKDLKSRISGLATALVSRDGLVLYADVPAGVYTETFAIMCATILGAAATANTELNRAPPERIVVEGTDARTLIVGCGKKALLVAVVDQTADVPKVLAEVAKVADLLKVA
jgi:predicted regulator of Ras-like GTPase activity (Roadblock/LC7/MglB family)